MGSPSEPPDDPDRTPPTQPGTLRRPLETSRSVGRYILLQCIGRGGMGTVYEAYDPELDRRIALKLVRLHDDTDAHRARIRLLREAQALARLSHPNVLAVHDAGMHGDDVFIATELVRGQSLSSHVREHRPPVRRILALYLAAGRGLAAAHAAGIIHRDFKPGNVMVGTTQGVRVLDFGLARTAEGEPAGEDGAPHAATPPVPRGHDRLLSEPLTHAGSVIGTPAYMAPEQVLGLELDARSDQFSFAVSLYEALYGRRPYDASSVDELRECFKRRTIPEPAAGAGVPAGVRTILLRALAIDPGLRWPSMDALLAALERHVRPPRWSVPLLAASAVAVIAVVALQTRADAPAAPAPCAGVAQRLAEAWNPVLRARVHASFTAAGGARGEESWSRVSARLDAYAAGWAALATETCEATRVRGAQSETLHDLRMQCLERRRLELGALVGQLATIEHAGALGDAAEATRELTPLAGCSDLEALTAAVPLPAEGVTRQRIAKLEERLAVIGAQSRLGLYPQGLAAARALVVETREVGFAPLHARALRQLGQLEISTAVPGAAAATIGEALPAAARAHDDVLAASLWVDLIWARYTSAGAAELEVMTSACDAAVVRAGDPPRLRAELRSAQGAIAFAGGRLEESLAHFREAARSYETSPDLRPHELARALYNIAETLRTLGRLDEAAVPLERGLRLTAEALGPGHVDIAYGQQELGRLCEARGDLPGAARAYRTALELRTEVLGASHLVVAESAASLERVLVRQGHARQQAPE